LKVTIHREIPRNVWLEALDRLPDYYAFDRLEWLEHQLEISGPRCSDESRLFEFSDGASCLLPVLRRRVGAIPLFIHLESILSGYGGFLTADALSEDHLRLMLPSLQRWNVAKISLFPHPEIEPLHQPLIKHGFERKGTFTHILPLGRTYDAIWRESFDDKMRNTIRKGEKKGLQVRVSGPAAETGFMDWYYDMYLDTVRRWGSSRISKKQNLQSLFNRLSDSARMFVCCQGDQPLSAIIILYGRQNLFYYANVSYSRFRDLAPNNFLLNEIIRQHCENWRQFNMGSSLGLPQVQKFKESFGAQKIDYACYVKRRI